MSSSSKSNGAKSINIGNAFLPDNLWEDLKPEVRKPTSSSYGRPIKTIDINKTFLQNTIQNVESHNRFEETQACWRQKELDEKSKRRRIDSDIRGREIKAQSKQENERQRWAYKKARTQSDREPLQLDVFGAYDRNNPPPTHGSSGVPTSSYSSDDDSSDHSKNGIQVFSNQDNEKDSKHAKKSKKHKKDKKDKKELKKERKNSSKKEFKFDVKLKDSTIDQIEIQL